MDKYLSVTGFGNVHEAHFEKGYELATEYFSSRNLEFSKCFDAYEKDQDSRLGMHWVEAEKCANLALYAFNLQNCSMLELYIENKDIYT